MEQSRKRKRDCLDYQEISNQAEKSNEKPNDSTNLEKKAKSMDVKTSMKCRRWIIEHYDPVIREIDIFVEDLLARQTLNSHVYKFDADDLQKKRLELIDRVRQLENKSVEYLAQNQSEFDDQKGENFNENEMKKQVFGENYCFVVKKINDSTKTVDNLVLVIGSYVEMKYIDYLQQLINSNSIIKYFKGENLDQNYIRMHRICYTFSEAETPEKIFVISSQDQLIDILKCYFVDENLTEYLNDRYGYLTEVFGAPPNPLQSKKLLAISPNEHRESKFYKDFSNLESLRELSITLPKTEKLHAHTFSRLTKLEYLSVRRLSDKPLLEPEKEAYKEEKDGDDIDETTFDALKNLNELELYRFNMENFRPRMFLFVSKLRYLLLDSNNIGDIGESPFEVLPNLEFLSMRYNKLKAITSKSFVGLKKLKFLCLDHNEIASIEVDSFSDISLKYLSLSHNNKLASLPKKTLPKSLVQIRLNHCDITKSTFDSFRKLTRLWKIWLDKNKVTKSDEQKLRKVIQSKKDLTINLVD